MSHASRPRRLFDPTSHDPFPLSRTKLALFLECPRCFYLDRVHGFSRPDGPPFTLNLAVDALLKKEFDLYRLRGEPHPAMRQQGIVAVPFRHRDLTLWRDTPTGLRAVHARTNFEVFGILDDVWQHEDATLAAVDYKATSVAGVPTLANRDSYKRQLEIYQWLLRQNGFAVAKTGYFVFANALKEKEAFNRMLEFTLSILSYEGETAWVEDALMAAKETLLQDLPPPATSTCVWCRYRKQAGEWKESAVP